MALDDRARTLAKEWIAAANRQFELAATAFDRQMWNEAVAHRWRISRTGERGR